MAGRVGRQVVLFFGGDSPGDQIPGIREKSMECNGEPIDITSDENSGNRELLENQVAQVDVGINISGVVKDTRIKNAFYNGEYSQPITLVYPTGDTLSGIFHLSSYSETDSYNEPGTFSATLMSSGQVTFTTV